RLALVYRTPPSHWRAPWSLESPLTSSPFLPPLQSQPVIGGIAWRVPRYRSMLWTEACPNCSWICSSSPPAERHRFAQVRRLKRSIVLFGVRDSTVECPAFMLGARLGAVGSRQAAEDSSP